MPVSDKVGLIYSFQSVDIIIILTAVIRKINFLTPKLTKLSLLCSVYLTEYYSFVNYILFRRTEQIGKFEIFETFESFETFETFLL